MKLRLRETMPCVQGDQITVAKASISPYCEDYDRRGIFYIYLHSIVVHLGDFLEVLAPRKDSLSYLNFGIKNTKPKIGKLCFHLSVCDFSTLS